MHNEFSNQAMAPSQGRGGYPSQGAQGGRGRGGYGAAYNQQMPYSPNANSNAFRPNPNQSRGAQNMTPGFQQQGQRLTPYPPSPHMGNRSPALQNAQPVHHQQGQMPMGSPMYPQHFGAYAPNMPQVNPQSSLPLRINHVTPELRRAQLSLSGGPRNLPTPDFSPHTGQFEQFLTNRNQGPYVQLDPQLASYYYQYNMAQSMHLPPGSPRPQLQHQPMGQVGQQQYFPGQYANPQQPQPMSRTPSAMSATDRPGSTVGRPQAPSTTPSVSQAPAPTRPAISPAAKPPSFQKPRKGGLIIKDPTTGAVMDFAKQVVSPPPKSSPANVASTPTPPLPRAGSQPDVQHHRSESKSVKTDEEKRNDMRDAIAKKMEKDKAEEKKKLEEEEAKIIEEKKAAEAQILKEKEEADAKQQEAAKAQIEAENAERKAKEEAEQAEQAAAKAKEEAEEKARKEKEEEEEFARIEAEMERQELEAEERYQKKKQAEQEEQARKAEENARREDENMKKAEREAEELEEARINKLEAGESEESRKERTNLFAALKKAEPDTPASEEAPEADTPEQNGIATPASDAPMAPPVRVTGPKPKPAALKLETTKQVESPQQSAQLTSLLSARRLLNINDVSYPSGFISPNPSLNTNAPPGKFNYDSKFLLQFSGVFVEKPSVDWETNIKQIMGDTAEPSSARSASTRGPNPSMGNMGQRQPSLNRPPMGVFQATQGARTLPPGTTSQDRFKQSTNALQAPPGQSRTTHNPLAQMFPGSRPGGFPIPGAKTMERNTSSTGMGNHPHSPRGNPSQRGGSTRGSKSGKPRESEKEAKTMPITSGQSIKPIEISATGWKPRSVGQGALGLTGPAPGGDGLMAPDVVQRKVKSNLNKMTPNNFMKISDQILLIAGQSKDESDGRTLRQVIQLTFEKATDEAHWAQMYAEFCKRMLESMSPEIKDEGILDKNGQVVVGGALFRKYLLNRCQTEFERGWKMDLPKKPEGESEEAVMLSDEYYIAAAAKRRGLGLVRFIGELYKLGMLTERIMHQCVHKLVDYEGMPDEAEVESLTSLLKTIGQNLDSNERGSVMMDAYFTRISTMIGTEGLPSRLKFMLMVCVENFRILSYTDFLRISLIYDRNAGGLRTERSRAQPHLKRFEYR